MPAFSLIAGGLGAGLSILGASQQRKAIERQRRYAIQAAKLRGDQLTARLGRDSTRALGEVTAGQANRNVFGRGSARARLALTSEALSEQAAINLNEFIQIGNITAEAESRKPNLFTAGLSGFGQGYQLATTVGSSFTRKPPANFGLLGRSSKNRIYGGFINAGTMLPVPTIF